MKKLSAFDRTMLVNIIDGVMSLIVLALSVEMFRVWEWDPGNLTTISILFFFSAASFRFVRAFMHRNESRRDFIRDVVGGILLLAGTALLFITNGNTASLTTAGLLYTLTIVTDRAFSVVRKHHPVNIALNVLIVVILLILDHSIIALVLLSIIQTMREILRISFSQMKMDVLWKVVRKTNAAEILFGMLLLIIAFSLAFPILEESIPNFSSALWYSFAIISTIGFGDVAAVSVLGRVLSAILGLCGLVVVSLVMSIVVNFYNETKDTDDDADDETANSSPEAQPGDGGGVAAGMIGDGDDAPPDQTTR